ncbi:anthranilate synthase component I family protein [Fictibacillus phosphorivorans]|uniref:anthranilate synthase component I family protein n=1 Tax=Fictibacillus phosphorivorans TaxID=1221500 RepID=UPI00203FE28B|nr:anthranilate synthase component I family protein [Fictibacillus phosphorivorans]MCM3719856.1 anthranilate synthase component I family protein [Fictibacillus phosphorivorans]MCM3777546.1 anthranilate synthase component I family protein [Fictibacillus phosphorivorans]
MGKNKKWHVLHTNIPLSKEDWFFKYKTLSVTEPRHVLLESGRTGRYSMIGLSPFAEVSGKDDVLTISTDEGVSVKEGPVYKEFQQWFKQFEIEPVLGLPDFTGGAIGYLSYDLAREFEKLPARSEDDLRLPDLYFLLFKDVFVYDHLTNKLWIIVLSEDKEDPYHLDKLCAFKEMWHTPRTQQPESGLDPCFSNDEEFKHVSMTEDVFVEAVKRIQSYISDGDVFQVNLSVRQSKELQTEPFNIYEELRRINPSPYMGYLQTPDFQLVSASPELLIKKKGDKISTRPIAGTRPRGRTEEEDLALANTLIENEKERAEHVMLVDLERNDLGKVSAYGTVQVDEFMVVERYSHVMHIVSNVVGELRPECDAFDCIKATFPGGTITGAPKVRTLEIIEELEPVRRGVYTGSVGWIGFNGDTEMNIAIRTMVCQNGIAHVQAGAGIVIDSIPTSEYKESLKKAEALWRAKEQSELGSILV